MSPDEQILVLERENERLWTVANDLRTVCSALLRGVPVRNADEVFVAAERLLGPAQRDGSGAGGSMEP